MMHGNGHWGWDNGVGMWLMMLVLWSLVVIAVIVVVRSVRSTSPSGDDAQRILDQRFARGEITEDEYNHRRAVLHSR